jgi:hypothetical protein
MARWQLSGVSRLGLLQLYKYFRNTKEKKSKSFFTVLVNLCQSKRMLAREFLVRIPFDASSDLKEQSRRFFVRIAKSRNSNLFEMAENENDSPIENENEND